MLTSGGELLRSGMPEPYRSFFLACGVPIEFLQPRTGSLAALRQITAELQPRVVRELGGDTGGAY